MCIHLLGVLVTKMFAFNVKIAPGLIVPGCCCSKWSLESSGLPWLWIIRLGWVVQNKSPFFPKPQGSLLCICEAACQSKSFVLDFMGCDLVLRGWCLCARKCLSAVCVYSRGQNLAAGCLLGAGRNAQQSSLPALAAAWPQSPGSKSPWGAQIGF